MLASGMASVRRKKGSEYWFACYTGPDGRRRQRSTKLTDKEAAAQLALSYEKTARAAREGRFVEHSARRFLNEVRSVAGVQTVEMAAARDWLERWVANVSRRLKPASARKYRDTMTRFLELIGPVAGAAPLAEVSPAQIAVWRDAMVASGKTEKTANIAVAIVGQAMREAVAQGVVEANPCAGLKFRKADAKSQQRSAFTLDQGRALLAATTGEWKTLVLVLALTAARQQEGAQLRWTQVDFERDRVTLMRGKQNDRPHVVPLDAMLRAHLEPLAKGATSNMVMPEIAAMDGKRLSKVFRQTILPRIGIKQPYGGRPGGKVVAEFSLHSLRHSLATWLDELGATPAQRRDMLGHETTAINERYTHAQIGQVATALGRVSAALGKAGA